MFKLNYEEIVEKIKNEKNISDSELNYKIKQKLDQLAGLISKDGAAHIVANELGVKVFDGVLKKRFKVKELITGIRNLEILGRIVQKNEVREYNNEKRKGKFLNFILGDETGIIRTIVWDENLIEKIDKANEGDIIKINLGTVRENNGVKEIHLGNLAKVEVNPENESIGEVLIKEIKNFDKKLIKELRENENCAITGTIVQVFEPRFYDACPECNKKVELIDGKYSCKEHGNVIAKNVPIFNLFLDDGTENIRVVLFRDNAVSLLGEKMMEIKNDIGLFNEIKNELLGKELWFNGRVRKNEMFERLEFNANSFKEINARELALELVKEIESKI